MKAVALINNTVNQMHHGCEVVVHQIEAMLNERGIAVAVSVMEGQHWKDSPEFMNSLDALDGIIVNGEGTIHHDRKAGRYLVEVAQLAKDHGLPCFLINTTYQENSENYCRYLKQFDRIYVRESESYRELLNVGIESEVVPDMTLSYDYRLTEKQLRAPRSQIGVTDSSMVSTAESLYNLAVKEGFSFLPVIRSFKENWSFRWVEFVRRVKFDLMLTVRRVFPSASYLDIRNQYIKHRVDGYLDALAQCKGVVSGRFHSDCFCLLTATPFLAIDGNSHKVSSMLRDVGLSPQRIIQTEELKSATSTSVFDFSAQEREAIKTYIRQANVKIHQSFDEIAQILGCHAEVKSNLTDAQVQVE